LQAAQKDSEARRAKFDELRRTIQYVEASRASVTKHMRLLQQPAGSFTGYRAMPSQTDAANRDHTGQLFSPHSIIWQVDREMALLLAGGRALLLQLAHPKVAAGVAQYSRFQQNPLARLQRTMSAMWS